MAKSVLVIFSDLDGTLLDYSTYSFEAALPGLELLREHGVPLIFCTSKTRAETELWRRALDNRHPFIVENGGAVYVPFGYFPVDVPSTRSVDLYRVIELGKSYDVLRRVLVEFRERRDPSIRGFGDMTADEIAERCRFTVADAELARQREYDEPFVGGGEKTLLEFEMEASSYGLRVLKGGRFHHLTGGNDKGKAVRMLLSLFAKTYGAVISAAIGDSKNDESMLAAVDTAVLVQKPDGTHDESVSVPGLLYAQGIGPDGWHKAVKALLKLHVEG
jgi:mannosyl-3-phosphoglycerate phosphatase